MSTDKSETSDDDDTMKQKRKVKVKSCSGPLYLLVLINLLYMINTTFRVEFQTAENTIAGGAATPQHQSMPPPPETIGSKWLKELYSNAIKNLPAVALPDPSFKNPFVFFHLRKAGGSSVRMGIFQACKDKMMKCWIPCKTQKQCVPYSLTPNQERLQVYASHIDYNSVMKMFHEVQYDEFKELRDYKFKDDNAGSTDFGMALHQPEEVSNCLVQLRKPVDRVTSCWNYRFIQQSRYKKTNPKASDMTPSNWDTFLPRAIDEFGQGCSNEAGRIFGSFTSETWLNSKMDNIPLLKSEMELVIDRLSKCVVLLMDRSCEDNQKVGKYYFPWMAEYFTCKKLNSGDFTKYTALTEGSDKVVSEYNKIDDYAYEFGEMMFEKQLSIIADAAGSV